MGKYLITLMGLLTWTTSSFAQTGEFKTLDVKFKKSNLELCLRDEKLVQKCIQSKIPNLSIESCFNEALKLKSDFLKEETLQYCFYQVSEFPTLDSCEKRATLFNSAENHDDALFECARQHLSSLNRKSCEGIAQKMRYPEKAKYMKRQCLSL